MCPFMPTGGLKAIRLKGPMFAADADYAQLRVDHQNRPQAGELTEQQFSRNEAKLGRLKQERAEHFRTLYAQPLGQAKPRRYGPKRKGIRTTVSTHTRQRGGRGERANLPSTTNKNNQEETTMTTRTPQRSEAARSPSSSRGRRHASVQPEHPTQSSKVHAHRLLALGIGVMPQQAPLVGALMVR